jgi:hypothetical protein
MKRNEALLAAKKLINGDRQKTYGDALDSHARIAAFWSAYLSVKLDAADVAAPMVLLKISRAVGTKRAGQKHDDSYVDGIGYLALAKELESRLSGPQKRKKKSDRGKHGKK